MKTPYAGRLFADAAADYGAHPFPCPSSNLSRAYTNPYGAELHPCAYCGFCQRSGCGYYAKSTPQRCVLPFVLGRDNFELRTHAHVTNVNLDSDDKRATGGQYASYIEGQLHAWREGRRRNDLYNAMKAIADKLSDDDIKAPAAYWAAVRPSRPAPTDAAQALSAN